MGLDLSSLSPELKKAALALLVPAVIQLLKSGLEPMLEEKVKSLGGDAGELLVDILPGLEKFMEDELNKLLA